jgi:transaldolase
MEEKNIMEKVVEVSPGMEIWWDSSPLIFDFWCKKLLNKATPDDAEILKKQFARMYNLKDPASQLFRGVTTNPSLSLQAINADEATWIKIVEGLIEKNPGIDKEGLFWIMYKEVVKRGSDMFLPLFEISGYKQGFLSGQVDPRNVFEKEKMLQQAEELSALNPNIMIKIPGSKEGYEVIEILTSRGISTNNTLTFILPQLVDCARSVKKGLEQAKKNDVDLSKWRSVITHMESRYGDLGGLRDFAKEKGVELSDGDVRLAELAIFKKAYKFVKENGYPSKMLSCSLRVGPTINGSVKLWHLEEKSGADIVMTCPPVFIEQLYEFPEQEKLVFEKDRILEDIPKDVMDKLMRIPYFERAYAEDGYIRDEYNSHPALVRTADQFSEATVKMVEFAGKCLGNIKS